MRGRKGLTITNISKHGRGKSVRSKKKKGKRPGQEGCNAASLEKIRHKKSRQRG